MKASNAYSSEMRNSFDDNEDKKLIEGCLAGKQISQEKLFKKYYGLMLGVCLRYSKNNFEARDILQEGFVKIFSNLSNFKFEGSFKGWMKKIMIHTAIDKYRKNLTIPVYSEINDNTNLQVNNDIISKLNSEDLLKCLNTLPYGYRTIFNLYVIEGYSHKEIAEKLGINEGTSKSQLFKAKLQLKEIVLRLYK